MVDEPEENARHDQNHEDLNREYDLLPAQVSEADAYTSAPRFALLSIDCDFTVTTATVKFPIASRNPKRAD